MTKPILQNNHRKLTKRLPAFSSIFLLVSLSLSACGLQGPAGAASSTPTSKAILLVATQTPLTDEGLPVSSSTPEQLSPTQVQTSPGSDVCNNPAPLTPALTEGPYFKANSPERSTLIDANTIGKQLILTGYVLTAGCKPVAHALLDFWQADAGGQYDNTGYTLRGHQFTNENGFYKLTTVVPGLYPGRTEHIHFKVQAPDGPLLTSQLFFPGIPNNDTDQIFDASLLIHITQESSTAVEATYNFIIAP